MSATQPTPKRRLQWHQMLVAGVQAIEQQAFGPAIQILNLAVKEARSWGEVSAELALSLTCLSRVYAAADGWGQAEKIMRQALELWELVYQAADERHNLAPYLSELGRTLRQQRKLSDAEALFRRALDLRVAANLPDDAPSMAIVSSLAEALQAQEHYAAAHTLYEKVLEYYEGLHGVDAPATGKYLYSLAMNTRYLGNIEEADVLDQRWLSCFRAQCNNDGLKLVDTLCTMANMNKAEHPTLAAAVYRLAITEARAVYGDSSLQTGSMIGMYADLLRELGQFEQAEKHFDDSITMLEACAPASPALASMICGLACLRTEQGRYEEAEPLYIDAMERATRHYQADSNMDLIDLYAGYLDLYSKHLEKTGSVRHAQKVQLRMKAMRNRILAAAKTNVKMDMKADTGSTLPEEHVDDSLPFDLEEKRCELNDAGLEFLGKVFDMFDLDDDGILTLEEQEKLYSMTPGSPFAVTRIKKDRASFSAASCTRTSKKVVPSARVGPDGLPLCSMLATSKAEEGHLSLESFQAMWSMLAFLKPKMAVRYLRYLGYPDDPRQLLRVTRSVKIDRQTGSTTRNIFHCLVLGAPGVGKTELLRRFNGFAFSTTSQAAGIPLAAVRSLPASDGGSSGGKDRKYLVLEELDCPGTMDLGELMPISQLQHLDVIMCLYSPAVLGSYRRAVQLRQDVSRAVDHHGSAPIPVLIVRTQTELDPTTDEARKLLEAKPTVHKEYRNHPQDASCIPEDEHGTALYFARHGVAPPFGISVRENHNVEELFAKVLKIGCHPPPSTAVPLGQVLGIAGLAVGAAVMAGGFVYWLVQRRR